MSAPIVVLKCGVRVAVEPTNEEWMVARHAVAVLRGVDATTAHNRVLVEAAPL